MEEAHFPRPIASKNDIVVMTFELLSKGAGQLYPMKTGPRR